jgi:hypothetical protein
MPLGRRLSRFVRRTAPLWVLLAVYWTTAIASDINIGHRHLLPTYPAMFILAGAAGQWFTRRWWRKLPGIAAAAALVFVVIESLWIHPHYLAYFNVLASGPRHGYRHMVDSSVDWGQSLESLARHLEKQGLASPGGDPVYLSYFGSAWPPAHGLTALHPLPGFGTDWYPQGEPQPLKPGLYCISASRLVTVNQQYFGPWCLAYEKEYQRLLALVLKYTNAGEAERQALLSEHSPGEWQQAFDGFQEARFARLVSMLRHRNPQGMVGYSILLYVLGPDDVSRAQFGPPLELYEHPQTAGQPLPLPAPPTARRSTSPLPRPEPSSSTTAKPSTATSSVSTSAPAGTALPPEHSTASIPSPAASPIRTDPQSLHK